MLNIATVTWLLTCLVKKVNDFWLVHPLIVNIQVGISQCLQQCISHVILLQGKVIGCLNVWCLWSDLQKEACNAFGPVLVQSGLLRSAHSSFSLCLLPAKRFSFSGGKGCSEPERKLQAVKGILALGRHQVHIQTPCGEQRLQIGFDPASLEVHMTKLTLYDYSGKGVSVAGLLKVQDGRHIAVAARQGYLCRAPGHDGAGGCAEDDVAKGSLAYVDAEDGRHDAGQLPRAGRERAGREEIAGRALQQRARR